MSTQYYVGADVDYCTESVRLFVRTDRKGYAPDEYVFDEWFDYDVMERLIVALDLAKEALDNNDSKTGQEVVC